MNRAALYFASGESLYLGLGILIPIVVISPFVKSSRILQLRNVVVWAATAMVAMAAPPLSWFVRSLFLGTFVAWFYMARRPELYPARSRFQLGVGGVLLVFMVTLFVQEFSRRRLPAITGVTSDHLAVIGDSISSGIDSRTPPWPRVLEGQTGVPVKNLARPGARTADGRAMVRQLAPGDSAVLIEIGGNDLLGGVPSDEFARDLDLMLADVAAPGRTIVMFELPLLPQKIAYGQIQRRLAAKYGVWLIPKRYFASVIGGENSTSDGLHLSDAGAREMAQLVAQAFSHVLINH